MHDETAISFTDVIRRMSEDAALPPTAMEASSAYSTSVAIMNAGDGTSLRAIVFHSRKDGTAVRPTGRMTSSSRLPSVNL